MYTYQLRKHHPLPLISSSRHIRKSIVRKDAWYHIDVTTSKEIYEDKMGIIIVNVIQSIEVIDLATSGNESIYSPRSTLF